ncbi:hypothetical protein KUCAC02_001147, partial [Chaenocephalus aceratus]
AIGMQGPGCFSEPDKSYLQRSSTGVLCHRSVIRRLRSRGLFASRSQAGPVLGGRQQKQGPRVTGTHKVDHA